MCAYTGAGDFSGHSPEATGDARVDFGSLLTAAVSLVLAGLGGIVWLVRLEGRINVQSARQDATDKRVDGLEDRILAQLDRIESRLDKLAAP